MRTADDMLRIAADVEHVVRRLRSLLHLMERLGFEGPAAEATRRAEALEVVARTIRTEVARYPSSAYSTDPAWDKAAADLARLRQVVEMQEALVERAALAPRTVARA